MKVLNETPNTPAQSGFNARYAATAIFKTIALLERSYAADYLDRILRAEDRFGFRDDSHMELETYGMLKRFWRNRVLTLMDVLVEDGYLMVQDETYGNLALTKMAEAFLDEPHDLFLPGQRLRTPPKDGVLLSQLRQLRKHLATESEVMPYAVFTNYGLKNLVKHKPADIASLKEVPGISHAQADKYGQAILTRIKDVDENAWKLLTVRKAHYPSAQEAKAMFLEGKSLQEIAEARNWSEDYTVRILENLHLAGEIDATAWIEGQVDAKVLNKGTKYFREVENPRLKAAYETLELDYRTLRMCRLYVSDVIKLEGELQLAA